MADTEVAMVQGSLFEEDYLIRTLGAVAHYPDVALTELVANAWDAGATKVEILIPENYDEMLVVSDNGVGLTLEEFHDRWMRLGYNRVKYQGKKAVFPDGQQGSRLAYGRKGVGRHGLLCFNDIYKVITVCGGYENHFTVSTESEKQPFVLQNESGKKSDGHRTRLEVDVKRNLPDPKNILEVISARFLHDPQFEITINGNSVQLEDHSGLIETTTLEVPPNICFEVLFIDTSKAARSTLYQGVAFWQGGRLVGEPSWVLGKNAPIDGRTRFAKQYTFVAKTDDLSDYVNDDWTGFIQCDDMNTVYDALTKQILNSAAKVAKEHIEETKVSIRNEFREKYIGLSLLGQHEVDEVIEHVTVAHPTVNQETVGIAVEAVINLEESRSGKQLLERLSQLSETDIEGLNRLLDQWSVKDALSVLDEIDMRLTIVEAIEKLAGDSKVDELEYLHPLITDARWLFGPEYDSSEYTSNSQLRTVAEKLFNVKPKDDMFENPKKRPDIVVVADSTLSITCTQAFDEESNLMQVDRILIIELKRGGSNITRDDTNQAVGYVEDFIGCKELGKPIISAYVVGNTIADKVSTKRTVDDQGYITVTTFAQLVDTARRRLFNLKKKLEGRYEDLTGIHLIEKAEQLKMGID